MAERSNASSTSSLTLPPMLGTSPDGGASPRRAVSPLLEVRRPHCTLNCESCNVYLEDIYRHSTWSVRCPWRVVYEPDSSFPRYRIQCSIDTSYELARLPFVTRVVIRGQFRQQIFETRRCSFNLDALDCTGNSMVTIASGDQRCREKSMSSPVAGGVC